VSLKHALIVDKALREGDLTRLIRECRQRLDVRLSGSGDLLPVHVPALLELAKECDETVFWGFTRNREVAEMVNGQLSNLSLIISVDATSPDGFVDGYEGPLAFGPRNLQDEVPDDPRIVVVFPTHRIGNTDKDVDLHRKDCPATRYKDKSEKLGACNRCKRCYYPQQHMGE
jgi:hypothetical protein